MIVQNAQFGNLVLLYFLETEAERDNRLNFGELPASLWNLIPEDGKYLVNIMKFCGYRCRKCNTSAERRRRT